MRIAERIALACRILVWRSTWARRDLDYRPPGPTDGPFMTARAAVRLIPDGACCLSTGMAGNARCSLFFWAIREGFQRDGRPRDLTWIAVGGQGGRGRCPGTVEELALPGLVTCFISGHLETTKAFLALAAAGSVELHTLPQGEMCRCIEAQAEGGDAVMSATGLDTVLDPRSGRGSPVTPAASRQFITPAGPLLAYRLPRLDVAVIAAPWADARGNVYFRDATMLTESVEAARAAKAHGGRVLVTVAGVCQPDPSAVGLPATLVDALVVNPRAEQTLLAPQRRCWRLFTPGGDGDDRAAIERLRFVNRCLRITPARGPVDRALARLAADQFARSVSAPAEVNVGVGYGEEVSRELYESELASGITFSTETGVYGGMPAPGVYFGAAVNPLKLESSAWMFRHYCGNLDAALLGFLEVDSAGNVNVSRRGAAVTDTVGPGGLPSITAAARTCLFVGAFMHGARWRIRGGRLRLERPGRPKLVESVAEVTFSGARALAAGKRVYFVTNVGVFQLTEGGLELVRIMPGVDPERDVRPHCDIRFALPPGGPAVVAAAVLTGRGYRLSWGSGAGG